MKSLYFGVVSTAVIALALACPALAQDAGATSDEAAQIDLQQKKVDLKKSQLELDKDTISAVKTPYSGDVTMGDGAGTAESMVLEDYSLRQAALIMATRIHGMNDPSHPMLVVFGNERPSRSLWLAYNASQQLLIENFGKANQIWGKAIQLPHVTVSHHGPYYSMMKDDSSSSSLAILGVETLAGLFKTDFELSGKSLDVSDGKTTAVIYQALSASNIAYTTPQLYRASDDLSSIVDPGLKAVNVTAYNYFLDYQQRLANVGGKTDKLPDNIVAAGQALETVLGNYQALLKYLYTPNDKGVLPAELIAYERDMSVDAPILYIRSVRAASSVYVKKNLFSGFSNAPVYISVTSDIDYTVEKTSPAQTCSESVTYSTDLTRVDKIKAYSYSAIPPSDSKSADWILQAPAATLTPTVVGQRC